MRVAPALCVLTFLFSNLSARPTPAQEAVSSAEPRTPEAERKGFRVPEGFEVQLVASEPEIHKPLNLGFDDRGRLWVTDTLEYPFPAAEGTTPRDGVAILSDFGPDGKAKVSRYATGLNIPIGVLPLPGGEGALVHSIPYVYKLKGGDKAEGKEPLFQSYGYRDTHGMTNNFTWGFDGWVYACHGFSNESTVHGADKASITMQSGNTYRMKPDGSHLEYVTHGQVNPFGLAFDPLGNLYSCDCHSKPLYMLLRGAYYPSFGKPDDGLGFGPEMAAHDHGSTAISGIVYYAADHFPEAYRDTVFIGNVVTNRINHDKLVWTGSTPKAIEQPDFLVSDDPWFRPVDIELGPDGALYVADFYNRIIGHYEVPLTHPGRDRERGRIWRIVYKGAGAKAGPRDEFTYPGIDPERAGGPMPRHLLDELGHPNPAVRTRAANWLVAASVNPLPELDDVVRDGPRSVYSPRPGNVWRRVQALWVLQRLGKLADETLSLAAADTERALRVHAMRVLAERPALDGPLGDLTRKALKDDDPFVQRCAAEALGRHPDDANLRPLLALRGSAPAGDTHLIHAVRIATRNQLLDDGDWDKLKAGGLTDREAELVADVAPGVHTAASAAFLFNFIQGRAVPRDRLVTYVHHVARYGDPDKGDVLAFVRDKAEGEKSLNGRVDLLRAYQQGLQERGAPLPDDARTYALSLAETLLDSKAPGELARGINLASSFGLAGARGRLASLVFDGTVAEGSRGEALAAVAAVDPQGSTILLARVLREASVPLGVRDRAATLLAAGNRPEAQAVLLDALPTAPERVQSAIAAGLAGRRPGAEALLGLVASGKASARLLQDNRVAGPLRNAGVPELDDQLATLLKGLPPADQRVNALLAARRERYLKAKADAASGAKVFQANCAACHQLGGQGAKIGPQLDGVGLRGLDRVLEDVLDPSRNVDQTFRVTSLALKDGRVTSGLLLREEGEVLVLADAQGKEVRVPKDSVEERTQAPLSPMPANFNEQITGEDFDRLLAYLLSQTPQAATR